MKKFLLVSTLFSAIVFAGDLPNRQTEPGVINPDVTQENIHQTICVSGWTKTIRPSSSYTNKLKAKQMKELGLKGKMGDYEEDHIISLQLGGHPTDPGNLWPELYAGKWGARKKDVVETRLKRMVCTGKITLKEAQTAIATDWIAAYNKYVSPIKK